MIPDINDSCLTEGIEAYHNNINYGDCPYPEYSKEARKWQTGWSQAYTEDLDSLTDNWMKSY